MAEVRDCSTEVLGPFWLANIPIMESAATHNSGLMAALGLASCLDPRGIRNVGSCSRLGRGTTTCVRLRFAFSCAGCPGELRAAEVEETFSEKTTPIPTLPCVAA